MYTHETKSSSHKAVANQLVQRRGGQTAPKAFVDRRSSNESQRALQRVMVRQSTIQMNKKLNNIIYYGYKKARNEYMEANNLNKDNVHCTVDSLNGAIGLKDDYLRSLPMGGKRKMIQDAIVDDSRVLSQDEKDWASWLRDRQAVLLMWEITGEQCRYDMNMKGLVKSWYNYLPFSPAPASASRNIVAEGKIRAVCNKNWIVENHSVNVPKRAVNRDVWTPEQIEAHNKYVDSSKDYDDHIKTLNSAFGFSDTSDDDSPVLKLTDEWLQKDVMHRFWRLTSLMGLDFFVAKKKYIVFVREENQKPHFDEEGRKSITDSEWEHAEKLKYFKGRSKLNGYVERVKPV